MEYVEGKTITDDCARRRLSVEKRIDLRLRSLADPRVYTIPRADAEPARIEEVTSDDSLQAATPLPDWGSKDLKFLTTLIQCRKKTYPLGHCQRGGLLGRSRVLAI